MTAAPTILLVGTVDTKSDELAFLRERLRALGAQARLMDVGVLAAGHAPVDIANTEVAAAAGTTLRAVIDGGDENIAMTRMAEGAAAIASRLHAQGEIQGLLALGGTMGTDLAFDVAAALPLGCPKVVLSTVAYSHLIPPERITPDLIMVLWAGGLYGLNSLCRSALAQAAGAVVRIDGGVVDGRVQSILAIEGKHRGGRGAHIDPTVPSRQHRQRIELSEIDGDGRTVAAGSPFEQSIGGHQRVEPASRRVQIAAPLRP